MVQKLHTVPRGWKNEAAEFVVVGGDSGA